MKTLFKIFAIILLLTAVSGGIYFFIFSKVYREQPSIPWPAFNNNASKPKEASEVTFLAVGDIMLSRDVAAQMESKGKDGLFPYANIKSLLSSTDFNFGNLESPFSGTDEQDPNPNTFTFNAPGYALKGLIENNFKVLNLANNHALNQGTEGMKYTKKLLTANSILTVGGGFNKEDAWMGSIYRQPGTSLDRIKIGFVGATYGPQSEYMAQISETPQLKKTIDYLKTQSDFVVVTMHAGTEYERNPNPAQIKFAKAAIDYGADIVIGAHPHWVQTIEKYKGKYIFYSLGNFIFDQNWSQDTKEGLTLKVSVSKLEGETTLKEIELIPIIIEKNAQPRVATEIEKKSIFRKIDAKESILK